MRTAPRVLTVTVFTAALALPAASAAAATPSGSSDFGQHVRVCAQSGEFDADHNPGTHQGVTGWDGHSCP